MNSQALTRIGMLLRIAAMLGAFLWLLVPLTYAEEPEDSKAEQNSPFTNYGLASGLFRYTGKDPSLASSDASLSWFAGLEGHHRYVKGIFEARLDHRLQVGPATDTLGTQSITDTVDEAYALVKVSNAVDVFAGQKRMGIGLASTFGLSDGLNPRNGYWDQRTGFRGCGARISVGDTFLLDSAVSVERLIRLNSADGKKLTYATGFEWLPGNLDLAGCVTFSPGWTLLPALGLSYDLGGFIVSAEANLECMPQGKYPRGSSYNEFVYGGGQTRGMNAPVLSFATGFRADLAFGKGDVVVAADYAFLGQGLNADQTEVWKGIAAQVATSALSSLRLGMLPQPLLNRHYLLPAVGFTVTDVLDLQTRVLVNLFDGSVYINSVLTVQIIDNADLYFSGSGMTGVDGSEFQRLPSDGSRVTVDAGVRLHW